MSTSDSDPAADRTATLTSGERSAQTHAALTASGTAGLGDTTFKTLTLAAGLVVLIVVALIAISTTVQAWPAFQQKGLSFFTSSDWDPNDGQFGALAFIYGTLLSSVIALVLAVPVSLGIALFTTEVAHRRAPRRRSASSSTCSPPSRRSSSACGASSCSCRRPRAPVYELDQRHLRLDPGPQLVVRRRRRTARAS